MPYTESDPEYIALVEHPDIVHPQLWLSSCCLIFYDRVEMYRPDRVLRQFGRIQHIPPNPSDRDIEIQLHSFDRRGAVGRDWTRYHNIYVDRWRGRLSSFVDYPFIQIGGPQTYPGYYEWYDMHTRRLISPVDSLDDIGFQVGDPVLVDLVGHQLISMSLAARAVSRDDDRIYDLYQENATQMYTAATRLLRRDGDSSNVPPLPSIPPQTGGRSTRRRSSGSQRSTGLEDDVRQTREGNYYASTSRVPPSEDEVGPFTSHAPLYGDVPSFGGMDDLSTSQGFRDIFGPSTSHGHVFRDLIGPSTDDVYIPVACLPSSPATPYPPAIDTHFSSWGPHLDLNLGFSNPQERMPPPRYNVSPVPFPSSTFRDPVHTTSSSSSRHDTEDVDDVPEEPDIRPDDRPRRARRTRRCGTGGHF